MIPFSDADPAKGPSPVNRLLLFTNVVVWIYILYLQRTPGALDAFLDRYAFDWSSFARDISTGAWTIATVAGILILLWITHER